MQGLLDNDVLAQEQQVAAHMRLCASAENAGCDIINLKSEPYKRADGQVGRQGRPAHPVAVRAAKPTAGCGCPSAARRQQVTPCPLLASLPCAGLCADGCGCRGRRHAVPCRVQAYGGGGQHRQPAAEAGSDQVGRLVTSRAAGACAGAAMPVPGAGMHAGGAALLLLAPALLLLLLTPALLLLLLTPALLLLLLLAPALLLLH